MRRGQRKSDTPGLVRKPSGIYWVVIHIPSDVQKTLRKTKHHQSTETRDRARAIEIWGRINAEWRQRIRDARSGQLRSISDDDLREICHEFLSQTELKSRRFTNGALDVRRQFSEWATDNDELVVERTYDDGGPQGEIAVYKTLNLEDLLEADLDRLTTMILETHVRQLEAHSEISLTSANQLKVTAATLRRASSGRISDDRVRLMDVFERWKLTQRLAQTIDETCNACELFIKVNGDLPVHEFARQHGIAFADHLAGQTNNSGRPLSPSTHAKKMSAVRAVFYVAMERDETIDLNPMSRVRVPGGRRTAKRSRGAGPRNEGWSISELQKLFHSAIYAKQYRTRGCGGEAAFWMPLLAIFTGARQSELAQLDVRDFKIVKGIPTLHITNETDDEDGEPQQEKRLKTDEQARRFVPLHAELIRLGFLEYADSVPKTGKLFPDIRPGTHGKWGEMYSKWFGRYRRIHAGVHRRWADFHAMRHTFTTACRAAGIPQADHEYLTGHSSPNVGGTYGTWSVPVLKAQIDRIKYADPDHLVLEINRWGPPPGYGRPSTRRHDLAA